MEGALQLPHHGTQPQQVAVHVADDALHPHAEYLCGMISSSVLVGWKKTRRPFDAPWRDEHAGTLGFAIR